MVRQGHLHDLRPQGRVLEGIQLQPIFQGGHPPPRPERPDGEALGGRRGHQRHGEAPGALLGGQGDLPWRALDEQQGRAAREQVDAPAAGVGAARHPHVGGEGGAKAGLKAGDERVDVVIGRGQLAGAAAHPGEALEQGPVHRGVDAQGEEQRPRLAADHGAHQARLVPRLAVGDEQHRAQAAEGGGAVEGGLDGGQHLGAASGVELADPGVGGLERLLAVLREALVEVHQLMIEGDELEPIAQHEAVEGGAEGGLGGLDLAAAHGARDVHDEDGVSGQALHVEGRRGLHLDHGVGAVGPGPRPGVLARPDLSGGGEGQDEVLVQRGLRRGGHPDALVLDVHGHAVQRGGHPPGAPRHRHLQIEAGAALQAQRGLEPAGVGHRVGVRQHAGALVAHRHAREIAGRDGGGEAPAIQAVHHLKLLHHHQPHRHRLPCGDPGHLEGVHVIARLGEQGRSVARRPRLVEGGLGLLQRLAVRLHHQVAAAQAHLHHRPGGGEREDVSGLHAGAQGVLKALLHHRAAGAADDVGPDLGLGEGEGLGLAFHEGDEAPEAPRICPGGDGGGDGDRLGHSGLAHRGSLLRGVFRASAIRAMRA